MAIENFTPMSGLIGGALIGLAAVLLMLLNGRIAGVAGIVGGILRGDREDAGWRLMFVLGLIVGAGAYGLVAPVEIMITASLPLLIAGGLLVGFGTQLGSGCTSGHGVCGIARLSIRSIAATATFMVATVVTVFVVRHVAGG